MKIIAPLLLALSLLVSPVKAWDISEMNKTVDQTNFVVNRGCSGTLIDLKQKLLLTNFHCIEQNVSSVERELTNDEGYVKKVQVRKYSDVTLEQSHYDGFVKVGSTTYIGEIVAEKQTSDLALVRINGDIPMTQASALLPKDKKVTRGERIYVVGNPGLNESSVVEGIISNVNRAFDFPWTNGARLPMYQFSGGIFGGNSGGSLYNNSGELIGVPAAGYNGATFIGLAVPHTVVKAFLKDSCFESVYNAEANDKTCHEEKAKKDKKDKDK